jgi:hypothetical protein
MKSANIRTAAASGGSILGVLFQVGRVVDMRFRSKRWAQFIHFGAMHAYKSKRRAVRGPLNLNHPHFTHCYLHDPYGPDAAY